MEIETLDNTTVAQLVAADYRTAEIFKRYGIDFCCGGKKSIASVCRQKNISAEQLQLEILALQNTSATPKHNFSDWQAGFLADYIVNVHHTYVKNNLAPITEFANKVALVHGDHNPETREIATLWKQLAEELTLHLNKEESILFPWIKLLESHVNSNSALAAGTYTGSVKRPVQVMEHEHDMAGDLIKRIQKLSNNFTPPEHACNTYRVLYAKLQEFENDLFEHIHLENNLLFEKAIILEETLEHEKMK